MPRDRVSGDGASGDGASGDGERTPKGVYVLAEKQPVVLVLTFRERVAERFRDSLPKVSKLRKALSGAAKKMAIYAREDKRVGKILEASLYAFENKKRRAAVLRVRDLELAKSQRYMDDALKLRVKELLGRYRTEAKKEMDRADVLDRQFEYEAALKAYTRVQKDFPLVDLHRRTVKRISEIWRKIQAVTGRQQPRPRGP